MTVSEMLVGRQQVSARDSVGRTIESVAWHEFQSDANLTVFFTDNTFLYLVGGENGAGPYLEDDGKPVLEVRA